jgi:hypothetical protein
MAVVLTLVLVLVLAVRVRVLVLWRGMEECWQEGGCWIPGK